MKLFSLTTSSIIAATLLLGNLTGHAQQLQVSDPLRIIYRVTGVVDGGASEAGIATIFWCTNPNTVAEKLQFLVTQYDGTNLGAFNYSVPAKQTWTVTTHNTKAFLENAFLNVGPMAGGWLYIRATSSNVFCTGMLVDAGAAGPQGIALHMVRSSAASGTQE